MEKEQALKQQSISIVLVGSVTWSLLTGCAGLNDRGMRLLSSKVMAFAIVDEQLVEGEIALFPDRTATLTLRREPAGNGDAEQVALVAQAPLNPATRPALTSCVGRMRYTGTTLATVDLRCNDGTVADLQMAVIGDTRGYGYGQTAAGQASLTFGMTAAEARAHLTVPPGKRLTERAESEGLELK